MSKRILVNLVSLSGGALLRERHVVKRLADFNTELSYHVLMAPDDDTLTADTGTLTFHTVEPPIGTLGRLMWENTSLMRWHQRLDPDLMYFPLHVTNVVDPCPKVSAVHNAAPFYPEAHSGASWLERARLQVLRYATKRTIRQSERVVFMSETTQNRVAEFIPQAREKGVVVFYGVPEGFEPIEPDPDIYQKYDLPSSFLLCVSNVSRYKNFVELIDGYALARDRTDIPPLCIAGSVIDDAYACMVRQRIERHGLTDLVQFVGYIDHNDLPSLHAASEYFVFSSACENAPVSLVEALACGNAIAASNVASMPEFCRDAAVYFDPYNPDDIGETLAALWENETERRRLRSRALDRASDFDWDKTARRTENLFVDLLR
jgi:glycosyltransferase involved in cell wall biosynthesis